MKNCPKCRVETRSDAEWCWFCGFAYDDVTDASPSPHEEVPPSEAVGPDCSDCDSGSRSGSYDEQPHRTADADEPRQ
jgi:hypothetical protein